MVLVQDTLAVILRKLKQNWKKWQWCRQIAKLTLYLSSIKENRFYWNYYPLRRLKGTNAEAYEPKLIPVTRQFNTLLAAKPTVTFRDTSSTFKHYQIILLRETGHNGTCLQTTWP